MSSRNVFTIGKSHFVGAPLQQHGVRQLTRTREISYPTNCTYRLTLSRSSRKLTTRSRSSILHAIGTRPQLSIQYDTHKRSSHPASRATSGCTTIGKSILMKPRTVASASSYSTWGSLERLEFQGKGIANADTQSPRGSLTGAPRALFFGYRQVWVKMMFSPK